MAGLVPAIPIGKTLRIRNRDARARPAHDASRAFVTAGTYARHSHPPGPVLLDAAETLGACFRRQVGGEGRSFRVHQIAEGTPLFEFQ